MKLPRRLPSPAMVVACVALSVALGGTSYAAIRVTGKNVRDGSLTGRDIKNNSVGNADVKNGGLLAKDFKAGQLPSGAPGPAGAKGETGASGAPGATRVVVRRGTAVGIPNEGDTVKDANAKCSAEERVTGGGIESASAATSAAFNTFTIVSRPTPDTGTPTAWFARAANRSGPTASGGAPAFMFAYVICASP